MNCFINTYYAYTKFIPTDIYPVQYGEEQCNRNHSFGPCVRSNYLLHYVYSGKGIFQTENNTYHLHKGQMFLISPNQLTYYKADDSDPWLYRWIEFNGSMSQSILKSVGLNESTPIYTDDENNSVGNALCNIISSGEMCFELLMQKFWNFIYCLTDGEQINTVSNAEEYIQKAETFIKTNVHKKIEQMSKIQDGYLKVEAKFIKLLMENKNLRESVLQDINEQQFLFDETKEIFNYIIKNRELDKITIDKIKSLNISEEYIKNINNIEIEEINTYTIDSTKEIIKKIRKNTIENEIKSMSIQIERLSKELDLLKKSNSNTKEVDEKIMNLSLEILKKEKIKKDL